jgi:cellulose biosynthesis protein BcsQ
VKIHPAIDLIPSSKDLMMCETEMVNCPNREFVLSEFIDKHWNNYDYIIIDNSSKAGLLMVNAIVASNLVIIPIADNCNTERTKKLSATITKTSKLLKDRKPKVRFMLNKKRDNTTGSATKKHIENACNGKFQNTELPKLKLYTQNTTEFWNPYKLSDNVCFKPLANEISNFKN